VSLLAPSPEVTAEKEGSYSTTVPTVQNSATKEVVAATLSWVFSPTSAEDFLTFSSVDSELSISPSAAVVAQTYSVTLTATPSNEVSSCSTTLSIVVVPKNTCPTLLHFSSFGNVVRQINLGDSITTDLSMNDVDAGQTVSRLSTKVGEELYIA